MSEQLENTHLDAIQPLVTPRQVKTDLPLTEEIADLVPEPGMRSRTFFMVVIIAAWWW